MQVYLEDDHLRGSLEAVLMLRNSLSCHLEEFGSARKEHWINFASTKSSKPLRPNAKQ